MKLQTSIEQNLRDSRLNYEFSKTQQLASLKNIKKNIYQQISTITELQDRLAVEELKLKGYFAEERHVKNSLNI